MNRLPGIGKLRRATAIATAVGGVLTAGWLGICAWYTTEYVGWGNLPAFLPHELALSVAGVVAPLAFVWLFLLYVVRSFAISDDTTALLGHLDAMVYPAEDAETNVARISGSLRQ